MSKQHAPLYALTKITDTEGLENGWYYVCNPNGEILPRMVQWYNNTWNNWNEMNLSFYLRPLPEGTVAVSEEELIKLSEWMNDVGREQNYYKIFKGVTLNVKLLLELYRKGLSPIEALNDLSTIC